MSLNPKHTKKLRQHLRNDMTETEVMLWSRLKGKQFLGYKIRRQYGVGNYIIDFYCPKLKLGIEVDGHSHYTAAGIKHDKDRDNFISNEDIELIRITNTEVRENLDGVLEYLAQEFKKRNKRW